MKVLLDEKLAHRSRENLGAHEVFTVAYRGWAGLKNGELLEAAEENGINVFLTGDRTLVHEQNLRVRNLGIVALSSVEWDILKDYLPSIIAAIDSAFRRFIPRGPLRHIQPEENH